MFWDRRDAGRQLAEALERYQGRDVLVLAIPRGGVEVGYEVAKQLDAGFSILVARKLPFPDNLEAGFGAVAEDGSTFVLPDAARWLPPQTVQQIIEEQKQEIQRRIGVLRGGGPLPQIAGRPVILVDDGIAMGSTMRASIELCKSQQAGEVVVAVPVASEQIAEEIGETVEDVVVLETPEFFRAVAQVYRNWYDVSDREVLGILEAWRAETAPA
jgi:predicted phosphoribosyltransferase